MQFVDQIENNPFLKVDSQPFSEGMRKEVSRKNIQQSPLKQVVKLTKRLTSPKRNNNEITEEKVQKYSISESQNKAPLVSVQKHTVTKMTYPNSQRNNVKDPKDNKEFTTFDPNIFKNK